MLKDTSVRFKLDKLGRKNCVSLQRKWKGLWKQEWFNGLS